ncbi:MAG: cobalamin-dependent protein [Desulfobacterales bacterium]
MNNETLLKKISENIIKGNRDTDFKGLYLNLGGQPGVIELTQTALEQDIEPERIMEESLCQSMEVVDQKYKSNEYMAMEYLASAKCVDDAMEILVHSLEESGIFRPKFVTAAGTSVIYQDTGPKVAAQLLRGFGYEVIDLGLDVPAVQIVDCIKDHQANYVWMSSINVNYTKEMEHLVNILEGEELHDDVKVVIGGAATTNQFAEKIGADAYFENVFEVNDILKSLKDPTGFANISLQ